MSLECLPASNDEPSRSMRFLSSGRFPRDNASLFASDVADPSIIILNVKLKVFLVFFYKQMPRLETGQLQFFV